MKTYTVTGATGYIGSQLLRHLSKQKDTQIFAIVREGSKKRVLRDNIHYKIYDGSEVSLEVAIESSDYLIHLGALYTTKTDEDSTINLINSNILFSTQLFNVANKVNKDIVIATASTFSSLNENGEYKPSTLYAATKQAVEVIAEYYENLSIHFLTFPDTYGENDWRPKIHNILQRNEEWPFKFRSQATQEIRMLNVEDIIGHLLYALNQNDKGVHIHDIYIKGSLLTLKELSELITNKECLFSKEASIVKLPKKARKFSKETGYINKHKRVVF